MWPGTFPLSSRTRRRLRSWEKISVLAAHTCIHACMHTYIHAYIHRYIPSFHTPSFFLTYHLSHTFRSFTTSFVFPSFPVGMITSHKACRKSLQNLRLHSAEHYIQTYMHTYIHTIFSHTIFLCHTRSFTYNFVPRNSFNFSILHHLLCLSFLPRPATTFVAHGPHTRQEWIII